MFCIPKKNSYKKATSTKAAPAVFVTPSLGSLGGEATIFTNDSKIKWESINQNVDLISSEDGKTVSCLIPGTYNVYVDDNECKIQFQVNHTKLPTILGYKVKSASGELSRDGEIEVITNIEDGLDILIAWSEGSFTTSKTLKNVKPGVYIATILKIGGKPVPCVHATNAAYIIVSGE